MDTSDSNFDLSLFFDLSADLLCISGFDGYFKKINPSVCRLLGYSEAELLAHPIDHFIHPDDQQITQHQRQNLAEGQTLLHFENRYLTQEGEIVWLTWTSMPIQSEQLVYAIAKEITHKKKFETDRNQILTELSAVNAELKYLGLTSAHDLRAPVNNLLSIFSLLEESKVEDPQTQRYLDIFRLATQALKESIDSHLDSLNRQYQDPYLLEWLDLEDSLSKVLHSLQALIQESQTKLEIDFSAFSQLYFKQSNLESILLNLINNAIKYSQPGQAPQISIYTQFNDIEQAQLVIADQGLGFDLPTVQEKLFGLNETFHDHLNTQDGSRGIGLYLVYNHVTQLGSKIHLESSPNQGSKFIITFKPLSRHRNKPVHSENEAIASAHLD